MTNHTINIIPLVLNAILPTYISKFVLNASTPKKPKDKNIPMINKEPSVTGFI